MTVVRLADYQLNTEYSAPDIPFIKVYLVVAVIYVIHKQRHCGEGTLNALVLPHSNKK